jgi:hypothetical protein
MQRALLVLGFTAIGSLALVFGLLAARPMGVYVDPDKMIAARKAGASPWELQERAFVGEPTL